MGTKILIALDYNPTAQKVAETGYVLAKAMQADITLLHVVADLTYYSSTEYSPIMGFDSFHNPALLVPDNREQLKETAMEYLDKTKQHLGDDVPIHNRVEDGDSADAILEVAKNMQADIIVMGTHSRSGLEKILMGSVAEKVLRQTAIPVFIIPTKKETE